MSQPNDAARTAELEPPETRWHRWAQVPPAERLRWLDEAKQACSEWRGLASPPPSHERPPTRPSPATNPQWEAAVEPYRQAARSLGFRLHGRSACLGLDERPLFPIDTLFGEPATRLELHGMVTTTGAWLSSVWLSTFLEYEGPIWEVWTEARPARQPDPPPEAPWLMRVFVPIFGWLHERIMRTLPIADPVELALVLEEHRWRLARAEGTLLRPGPDPLASFDVWRQRRDGQFDDEGEGIALVECPPTWARRRDRPRRSD